MICLDVQGLERNVIGKLVRKNFFIEEKNSSSEKSEEEVCSLQSLGDKCEDICVHVNTKKRVTSAEENFNK